MSGMFPQDIEKLGSKKGIVSQSIKEVLQVGSCRTQLNMFSNAKHAFHQLCMLTMHDLGTESCGRRHCAPREDRQFQLLLVHAAPPVFVSVSCDDSCRQL